MISRSKFQPPLPASTEFITMALFQCRAPPSTSRGALQNFGVGPEIVKGPRNYRGEAIFLLAHHRILEGPPEIEILGLENPIVQTQDFDFWISAAPSATPGPHQALDRV